MAKKQAGYFPLRQMSKEWEEIRKNKITSSTAPACLGHSPWMSAQKACRIVWGEESATTDWYLRHSADGEKGCIEVYEQATGNLCRDCGFWVHPEYPWLGASPDRRVLDGGIISIRRGQQRYEDCPAHWRIQAKVQLACSGELHCDVCHFVDGKLWVARVDREGVNMLLSKLENFFCVYIVESRLPKRGEIDKWENPCLTAPIPFVQFA